MALAERSPDTSPHRSDEPYRRAISGIYARLSATCRVLLGKAAPRHPVGEAEPYADAAALAPISRSCTARSRATARGRSRAGGCAAAPRGGGVRLFTWRRSTCARTPTCTSRWWRSCSRWPAGVDYLALDEEGRIALLLEEIASPRPLYSPYVTYSELSTGELAILRMAREAHQRYGTDSVPNCIISKTDGVSDMLELALLLKGDRPARSARRHPGGEPDPAVRDHRRPAGERPGDGPAAGAAWGTGACSIRAP